MKKFFLKLRKSVILLLLPLFFILKFSAKTISRFRLRHPLASFIFFRVLAMVGTLLFLGLLIFFIISFMPGDIVTNYVKNMIMTSSATKDNVFTSDQISAMKHELYLDRPFFIQYGHWLYKVFIKFDLGTTAIEKAPVLALISTRLGNTLVLNLISLFFLTAFSFVLGIYFSSKAGTKLDIFVNLFGLFFHAFPFLLLLLFLKIFAYYSGVFPIRAYPSHITFAQSPLGFSFSYLHHIFLPLLGAFLGGIGGTMRMIRSTMLDQLNQPYVKALRARGIGEKRIHFAHAFRNTMNPFITSSATMLASLFSGSLILEKIFDYPGIGMLMFEAVLKQDINLLMSNVMFISFFILIGMMISDILLAFVDPRVRYGKD